jgi:mono/diheme cytochrome c family protein
MNTVTQVLAGAALMGAAAATLAADARQTLLDRYAAQARQTNPQFAGFDAARGRALYLGPHTGGNPNLNACAVCHTKDPKQIGTHFESKRDIEPMAVSVTPDRFLNEKTVEKRFARKCVEVLGRSCTAQEKGDFITFLMQQ